ncbi:MAG: hypothetical protein RL026_46 [Pseudomonadota bacterium]|jgi:hypothetical protein
MQTLHDTAATSLASKGLALVLALLITGSLLAGFAYAARTVGTDLGLPRGTIDILPLP